jgi:hypothetical protein
MFELIWELLGVHPILVCKYTLRNHEIKRIIAEVTKPRVEERITHVSYINRKNETLSLEYLDTKLINVMLDIEEYVREQYDLEIISTPEKKLKNLLEENENGS